eukprot:jgi/Chrpa1/6842/Chrysochromulina_OHIO_Genome00011705-RA
MTFIAIAMAAHSRHRQLASCSFLVAKWHAETARATWHAETARATWHAETARHVACSFLVATWHSPHACYSTVGILDLDERSYIMQVQRHVRWARDARIR